MHSRNPSLPLGIRQVRSEVAPSWPSLYERYRRFINPQYPPFLSRLGLDSVGARGEGATITDSEGKTYIDCVGGFGALNLGHNHPAIVQALIEQLSGGTPFGRPLVTDIQIRLAETLSAISPGDLVCSFLCNSGSEAIESALKLARLHGARKRIVTTQGSFHGYTLGALAASGIPAFKRPFEPLMPEVIHVPFGDRGALAKALGDDTAAVVLELIQHEAGISMADSAYFAAVRRRCDETGTLLIIDEVKTGLGKTGWLFACDAFGVVPDMLVLGKSLGGGLVPVGVLVATETAWRRFGLSFPMSASSYAGNPLACRAAMATLEILQGGDLLESCRKNGCRD